MDKVTAEVEELITEYLFARDASRKWSTIEKQKREDLNELVGENFTDGNALTDARGERTLIRVKHVPSLKVDLKRLRSEYPQVYADCQVEANQIRLERPKE